MEEEEDGALCWLTHGSMSSLEEASPARSGASQRGSLHPCAPFVDHGPSLPSWVCTWRGCPYQHAVPATLQQGEGAGRLGHRTVPASRVWAASYLTRSHMSLKKRILSHSPMLTFSFLKCQLRNMEYTSTGQSPAHTQKTKRPIGGWQTLPCALASVNHSYLQASSQQSLLFRGTEMGVIKQLFCKGYMPAFKFWQYRNGTSNHQHVQMKGDSKTQNKYLKKKTIYTCHLRTQTRTEQTIGRTNLRGWHQLSPSW